MIKSDFGRVEIHGNIPLLKAELCGIITAFFEEGVIEDKEELEDIIETAMKSDEEVHEDLESRNFSTKDMQDLMQALLEARISGLKREEDEKGVKVTKILDNDRFKITKIELDGKEKSKEEIEDILKKLFEEGEMI